ncbi:MULTISPECIES: STAS/SEC14 domain-containing protein [Microbulbifer]|uniref:STAS/SEC14 domain-containing protein n=1 Tax=Microbulbifer TaxID=48073 RepID=UPI001E4B8271|nr:MULTISPECIES: STAS/SEC14 domain-containing protein [Microbulbifer]UHQ53709.1 STAS/SEC14 domain-containing protein [Microbulbifer sp. YPW16]
MTIKRHGLSVGLERIDDDLFLSLRVKGKLTHRDYEAMVPILESALAEARHPKINVFFDATELEGWEARAAWDDLKLGLRHGRQFHKVAMVGHKRWQELATRVGAWFIGGDARFFEDEEEAMAWLASD